MVAMSSRRAARLTPKTKLLVYRGSDKVDPAAEVIQWDNDGPSGAEATKHQHVGAKGVEHSEALEHHLQAALSSSSLRHSQSVTKPSSPSLSAPLSTKLETVKTHATLDYHIPTPDATGLIDTTDYAKLYQSVKWVEPTNYIRFSDTVEESSGGSGGLGYCMDDNDVNWLKAFNVKAEGATGDSGASATSTTATSSASVPAPQSPLHGRGERRIKGGKEKEKADVTASLQISEEAFEYVMGVMEKHVEDTVPMLHTNLSLMPTFSQIEPLFSSPLPASFYPSHEVFKGLPDTRTLARMARSVYPHWKSRRELRGGKSIMPLLNYDETNDGDPYVCFRRRDVRAARKTRRTDHLSVERMQKIQYELRKAHEISQLVLRREYEKLALFRAEKSVWEAKWKLYETKRRWPVLGISRDEEEIITGRQNAAPNAATLQSNITLPLSATTLNMPQRNRKLLDKERDDRERRDRVLEVSRATTERLAQPGKSMAPEAIRERIQALHVKLDDEIARRKNADSHWDDHTDSSYQPLPTSNAAHAFRPINVLDPHYRSSSDLDSDDDGPGDDGRRLVQPRSFRLRRGRGGRILLDRRLPVFAHRRNVPPSPDKTLQSHGLSRDWLFPDSLDSHSSMRRPRSIDDDDLEEKMVMRNEKRRRINEMLRYDADRGGGLGIGMGLSGDDDRVVIDDFDGKYIRHRITLLQSDDIDKLQPDKSNIVQAITDLDAPIDLPPPPRFIKPVVSNPQIVAYHQQQILQQQQMEQLQRFQMMAQQQQQVMEQARIQQQQQQQQQQQVAYVQAQAQAQQVQAQVQQVQAAQTPGAGQQMLPPNGIPAQNGRPPIKRPPSTNGQPMAAPGRTSLSPSAAALQQQQLALAGQSPHIVNNTIILPNGKPFLPGPGGAPGLPTSIGAIDPQLQQQQQRMRAHVLAQQAQNQAQVPEMNSDAQTAESRRDLAQQAQANGFGTNIQAFLEAKARARLFNMAKGSQQVQAAVVAGQQQQAQQVSATAGVPSSPLVGTPVTSSTPQAQFGSPSLSANQLQLKLPPHAAARLAGNATPQRS